MLSLCDGYLYIALSDFEQAEDVSSTHLAKHPSLLEEHQQIPPLPFERHNEAKLVVFADHSKIKRLQGRVVRSIVTILYPI